ncbi:MAG: hypothetical protein SGARI_006454 [Bacillariaceae sp.]
MDVSTTKSVTFGNAETASMDDTTNIVTSASEPLYLRWSRLQKTVTIKESNSGLLRGSIAAPTPSSADAFKKQGTTQKVILDEVSGCAAPGEVLAMMG